MHKLQTHINQKLESFFVALPTKDSSLIKNRLHELSLIGEAVKEETISKLHLKINPIISEKHLSKYQELQEKLRRNKNIIQIVTRGKSLMKAIEENISISYQQIDETHSLLIQSLDELNQFEELSSFSIEDIKIIREQLYLQILIKVTQEEEKFYSHHQDFQQILDTLHLPLKKDEFRKEEAITQDHIKANAMMYKEYCLISLRKQVNGLLQKEDNQNGKVFQIYWAPVIKTVLYLFTGGTQLHNLEEPGWMFQYLQLTLNANYKYFQNYIFSNSRQEIAQIMGSYFLSGSTQYLLFKAINIRITADLNNLNPFLLFNFLDQLGGLEDKLFSAFGLRAQLLQKLLLKHNGVLQKSLEYENQWFQTKIFQDFININYSQINLKNLEAFNLLGSFLNLLERLYRKYRSLKNVQLRQKVAKFYRQRIMVLVAHLKTSFDRIYNHSKLPRIDILISFKRTENELRTNLVDITMTDHVLDQYLQKQYYCYLQQYYQSFALETLTPIHRKMHISLGDIINKLSEPDESGHNQIINGFKIIHKEWVSKLDQIWKFGNYVDSKLRTIFFTYLEASFFSYVGLNLFIKIFEPFLQIIFNQERHRTLLGLITMTKQRYQEYLESHTGATVFLTPEQTTKLNKFKLAHPNL